MPVDVVEETGAAAWARMAFDAAPSALLVVDGAGRIVLANAQAERLFARARAELIGSPLEALIALEPPASVAGQLAAARSGPPATSPGLAVVGSGNGVGEGGGRLPVELALAALGDAAAPGAAAVAAVRDLGQQRRTDELRATELAEARAARDRLEVLLDHAPAFIIGVSLEGTIDFINRTLPQHPKKDVIGTSWLHYVPPERRAIMQAALERAYVTDSTQSYETNTPGPDGAPRWFDSHIAPIRAGGKIAGAVLVSQDVTERKLTQAELLAGRHMALLGTLVAGVAHEINTPIQFVGDSIHFLRGAAGELLALLDQLRELREATLAGMPIEDAITASAAAEDDADVTYLRQNMPAAFERCIDGLDRVANIVRSLKEFAHPSEKEMVPVDLNRAIQSTLTIATNEYKYVADLETDLGELPPVTCHAREISQAILNIVVNAAHAIGDAVKGTARKGLITVRTWKEGDRAVIAISDTGTGIPPSVRPRIFDPFFTTKEVGKGTGQGLAIACATVREAHGGELDFETEVGKGTTFFIRLPIVRPATGAGAAAAAGTGGAP